MRRFLRSSNGWVQWLLAALVETAVATPWMLLLYAIWGGEGWAEAVPAAWLLLLLFLTACLWESTPLSRRSPSIRIVALLAGTLAGYLIAYALLPDAYQVGWLQPNRALTFVPVAAYLWYQGARTRIAGLEYGHLFSRFPVQFIGLFAGVFLLTVAHKASSPEVQLLLYWSVFLLFAAGLSLLLLVRTQSMQQELRSAGEPVGVTSSAPVTTVVVLLLALMTVVSSLMLSGQRLMGGIGAVGAWVGSIARWFLQVALLVAVRWAQLLLMLLRVTYYSRVQEAQEPPEILDLDSDELVYPGAWTGRWSEVDLTPYLMMGLAAVLILVLAFLLVHLRRRQEVAHGRDEERSSLGFWRSLWADLRLLVEPLRRKSAALAGMGDGRGESDPGAARRIYRAFQQWGTRRGRSRRIGETPNRYQQALASLWPGVREEAATITAMYNQARYGPAPPREETVSAAREALARLEEEQR